MSVDAIAESAMVTVLGAGGFIGSHLIRRLRERGANCFAPERDEKITGKNLGHVIYSIGLTADFRTRPFETVDAHVCRLSQVLRDCDFHSFLYLSSTRLYKNNTGPAEEHDPIALSSSNRDDLYDISKLIGESLTLSCDRKTRVARLSNVYGEDFQSKNFLSTILKQAVTQCEVVVRNAPNAEKDYISVHDAVEGLIAIALRGQQNIYNLASGTNVSMQALINRIRELVGCRIAFAPAAPATTFPAISINRMRSEFGFQPSSILGDLEKLLESYRENCEREHRRS
jgi:nucleoside-diphosphate-sugar epimerase